MIDALAGAVIMIVATTSLLLSIEVAEEAFQDAGQYPLNKAEETLLTDSGISQADLDQFWEDNLKCSWLQWGNDDDPECFILDK